MNIAIGSDHGGFELKSALIGFLKDEGHEVKDFGTHSVESCDYPKFSYEVALSVAKKEFERGILVCKSGIGSSMVANKVPGIRAAVCNSVEEARLSKEHNDTNVIVFGSKFVTVANAKKALTAWLIAEHTEDRHKRRINQIKEIERKLSEGK